VLFLPLIAQAKEGWIVVFEKVDGLVITSHFVETTKTGEDWLVLKGVFTNKNSILYFEGAKVPLSSMGNFQVKSKFLGAKHSVKFLAKNASGDEQIETVNFTEGARTQKPVAFNRFFSEAGMGFYRYIQTGSVEQYSTQLAITVGGVHRLANSVELGLKGLLTLTSLNKDSELVINYRDVFAHAVYPLNFVVFGKPLNLLAGVQFFYSTMSVTLDALGYQNLTGEGPKVYAEYLLSDKILLSAGTTFNFLNRSFGFSSHCIIFDLESRYQINQKNSLGLHLEYLNAQDNSSYFARNSTQLNLLYSLIF
jgi:hypothetical protein